MNKTIIHYWSGGWCEGTDRGEVIASCLKRSKESYGSTKTNATQNPWFDIFEFEAFFSGNHTMDLDFYNWNRFIYIYCDGTGHQGFLRDPIDYNGT